MGTRPVVSNRKKRVFFFFFFYHLSWFWHVRARSWVGVAAPSYLALQQLHTSLHRVTSWFVLAEPLVELSCESLEQILASSTGLSAAHT